MSLQQFFHLHSKKANQNARTT